MEPPAAAMGRSPPLSRTASLFVRAVLGSPLSRAVVAAASVFSSRLVAGRRAARGIAFAIGRPDAWWRAEAAEGVVDALEVAAAEVVAVTDCA